MNTAIKLNTETIETVMTYSEWERIHTQKARKRKAERKYYIKQKIMGVAAIGISIVELALGYIGMIDGGGAFIIMLPLGIFLIVTKQKVMMF